MLKGPSNVVLSKTSMSIFSPRKMVLHIWSARNIHTQVQIVHSVCLYLWITGLIYKNTVSHWSNNCVVATLPIIIVIHVSGQLSISLAWIKYLWGHLDRTKCPLTIRDKCILPNKKEPQPEVCPQLLKRDKCQIPILKFQGLYSNSERQVHNTIFFLCSEIPK